MLPTFAEINLSNLKYNFINIRKKIKNTKIMAVVKADAYGHGMIKCVEMLSKLHNKPDYYAVTYVEEAIDLRKAKIKDPILIFTPVFEKTINDFYKYDIIPTVFNKDHIDLLKKVGSKKKLKVHIKIDTGMSRMGVRFDEALEFIEFVSRQKEFIIDGIYSHFATSDEKNKTFAKIQLSRFRNIIEELKRRKINYGLAHIANSGAILDMPDSYFDMVRPGISLYGYYPSQETKKSIKLKPAMTLVSTVSSIKEIQKGDSVSYGRKFIAKRKTKVATVPFGYAGGYFRSLSNKSTGIINGKKYKQIGQVCMDIIMFNIDSQKVKIGDRVVLMGRQGKQEITVWDWTKVENTIPYEVICNVSGRVPRVFIE